MHVQSVKHEEVIEMMGQFSGMFKQDSNDDMQNEGLLLDYVPAGTCHHSKVQRKAGKNASDLHKNKLVEEEENKEGKMKSSSSLREML